jgi:glycosyltransferase involved in cell wall biosynthesis
MREMKVAILTTDNRQHYQDYANPVPHFGTAPEALLQGFATMPDLEVHVLSCAQQPMRSPEKLAENIWFHSLHVPHLGWMRTAYQGCIRATRKKLKEIRPGIVHGQGTERECGISAIFSGFPNVLTIHGNMRLIARVNNAKPFSFSWLAARLEAFTVPRAAGVVCITHYTQEAMTGLARRTWVVPNAVDPMFFEIKPELKPEEPPAVLCVGNICYRKNQNALIRALDGWASARELRLVFLGHAQKDEPYGAEFFDLIKTRPWCSYEGFADRLKLKEYLRRANLLVLPTLEDNCPMVVLEAMAASVPALAAKVGGIPDLIEEGVTGFFCDPTDAASMRAALQKALGNAEAARQMAIRANQRARERFHPRVIAERHREIYCQVLGIALKTKSGFIDH